MIYNGDCLSVLATLDENSIDTCITDPPYGLNFMGKNWDNPKMVGQGNSKGNWKLKKGDPGYVSGNAGWYGHCDMAAFQEWTYHWATEVYRVLKPGAILLAFGGTRTYHRMVCAIEDAGFEIRDTIAWVYGSGFPKSLDIGKAIDKQAGAESLRTFKCKNPADRPYTYTKGETSTGWKSPIRPNKTNPATPEAQLWDGWGTALKPAFEPIVVAMKPIDGTYVNNALTWGVAGLWIDGGRVAGEYKWRASDSTVEGEIFKAGSFGDKPNPQGRFPANLIHDGSDEVVGLFPQTKSGAMNGVYQNTLMANKAGVRDGKPVYLRQEASEGSAARFFYCAKASRSERNAGLEGTNHHPTIKPIELMRYLVRLTKTPTGGVVLDPFTGSGTTGIACELEGREFIGIEREAEYVEIAEKRIAHYRLPILEEAV